MINKNIQGKEKKVLIQCEICFKRIMLHSQRIFLIATFNDEINILLSESWVSTSNLCFQGWANYSLISFNFLDK